MHKQKLKRCEYFHEAQNARQLNPGETREEKGSASLSQLVCRGQTVCMCVRVMASH